MGLTAREYFERAFGKPARETKKVIHWKLRPGLDIVLEKNLQGVFAQFWIPPEALNPIPDEAKRYDPGRGRHSNTYAASSLARGMPALVVRIYNEERVMDTIKLLQAVPSHLNV